MVIKKLNKEDLPAFRKLIEIFNEVFENDQLIPADDYLIRLLSNPDFIVFVAVSDTEVLGGLTIHVLHSYYSGKPAAYIYDFGIAPAHQGKGYGKALMSEVCEYCKQHDFEYAYVEAESDDTDAVGFYRKTACSSELKAIHFTYDF